MYSNGINEKQNEDRNLIKLAAMRQLYTDAKSLFYTKFIICTVLVALGNVMVFFNTQNALINYVLLLIKILSAVVPFLVFDKWVSSKKELAATIQEEFDNAVLSTNWNEKQCGAKGTHNQEIIKYKTKYVKKSGEDYWRTNLINWYDKQFTQMQLSHGRIHCQATNINWDKELRIKFQKLNFYVLGLILLILFVVSFIFNMKFISSLEYIFLPSAPVIIFLVQIIMANNKTLNELTNLSHHIVLAIIEKDNQNTTEEKLINMSNKLQEKIFSYRKNAFLIPDKYYLINRNKQENLMKDYAKMELQQFGSNK